MKILRYTNRISIVSPGKRLQRGFSLNIGLKILKSIVENRIFTENKNLK